MATVSANTLQTLAPGIQFAGSDCMTVCETTDVVHVLVAPEKEAACTLFVVLNEEAVAKKYKFTVEFNHPHAEVTIYGLYQLRDKQAVEIQSIFNHNVPHCASKQVWRGILNDSAKAAFEGKIIVAPHAQKTDAQLSNKNLLLSKSAEINTKPILEIYADDVKCSHGATVGCLDDNALFYLRSRGIEESTARELLIDAFANEVLIENVSVI
jgi:Fe-S cluster assembly protein SufD